MDNLDLVRYTPMASAGAHCNGGLIDLKLSNYDCDGGEFKLGRADAT